MTVDDKKKIEELYEVYLYAFPLIVLDLHFKALTNTEIPTAQKAPMNQYLHAKGVASARDKEIVHPNIDTVYSKAHMDLKEGPLYFHKPKTDRYTAAELIDAYGNCIAIIGSGGIGEGDEVDAVLVGPNYEGMIPNKFVRIDVPTNLCWTLTRVIKDVDDEEEIAAIQQGFDIRPLSAYRKDYIYPKGTYRPEYDFIPYEKLGKLTIEEFFAIFNRLIGDNLGNNPDWRILNNAKKYGIGDGKTFCLLIFTSEVREELEGFFDRATQEFDNKVKNHVYSSLRNNWIWTNPELANFKKDYSFRAKVAWGGFGANPITVAIYSQAYVDSRGELLSGQHKYICHFFTIPPVKEFWSLTVYGEDQFLIPNELDRNGINDRSPLILNDDGSLDIYIQKERPSEDKVNNWLPVGKDAFGLVLRMYSPEDAILEGTWNLPKIERVL